MIRLKRAPAPIEEIRIESDQFGYETYVEVRKDGLMTKLSIKMRPNDTSLGFIRFDSSDGPKLVRALAEFYGVTVS